MAKMKSVCASGKYSSFCTELPGPLPPHISAAAESHQRLSQLVTAAKRVFHGFQKDVTRRIRYGSARISSTTAEIPMPIMAMNCHSLAPPRNSIARVVTNNTTTVPRSAPAAEWPVRKSRPSALRSRAGYSDLIAFTHQVVGDVAKQRQFGKFRRLNTRGPNAIQRDAPFTELPTTGTISNMTIDAINIAVLVPLPELHRQTQRHESQAQRQKNV